MARICIFVPGFGGTDLLVSRPEWDYGIKVWLGAGTVAMGGYRALDQDGEFLESLGIEVSAGGLVQAIYYPFLEWLSDRFDTVDSFPFDWRSGIGVPISRLVSRLRQLIVEGHTVTVIGHSTGGKIAVAACNALTQSEAGSVAAVVTIGTPFRGSWRAVEALIGRAESVQILTYINAIARGNLPRWERQNIMRVLSSFQGLYELFPSEVMQSEHTQAGVPNVWDANAYAVAGVPINPTKLQAALINSRTQIVPRPFIHHVMVYGVGFECPGPFSPGDDFRHAFLNYALDGDGVVPVSSSVIAAPGQQTAVAVRHEHATLSHAGATLGALATLL